MHITIEKNKLIYISLQDSPSPIESRTESSSHSYKTLTGVKGYLLYDEDANWLGYHILPQAEIAGPPESIDLPTPAPMHLPMHTCIQQNDEGIILLFDNTRPIAKRVENECNLDVNQNGLVGIEIILYARNSLGGKELVSPFLMRDL